MSRHTFGVSALSPSERGSETQTIVGARLTAEQSLAVFRVLLSAVSRPGTLVELPEDVAPGAPRVVVPVLALADLDVSVATLGGGDESHRARWSTVIADVTGSRNAPPAEADVVTALRHLSASDVAGLRGGTAEAPELGARLFAACDSLGGGLDHEAITVRLRGPGVPNSRTLSVTGIDGDVIAALAANRSFPAGIDTWLVSTGGVVAAIPRSTRIELVDEPGGTR